MQKCVAVLAFGLGVHAAMAGGLDGSVGAVGGTADPEASAWGVESAAIVPVAMPPAPPPRKLPGVRRLREAQNSLLERGVGNAEEALHLFRVAAEAGNALAAYNVGYYYQHGIGVTADPAAASAWYRRSAAAAQDGAVRALARESLRRLERTASAQR